MSYRQHLARAARSVTAGGKDSAVAAGVGLGSYFATQALVNAAPSIASKWWSTPLAMAAIGHVVKRKSVNAGTALLGAAGYAAGLAYVMDKRNHGFNATPNAQGLEDWGGDAGALVSPEDAAALMDPADAAAVFDDSDDAQGLEDWGGDAGDLDVSDDAAGLYD